MKKIILLVIACLLFGACTYAQETKTTSPEVQKLIDRTLKNMVFVEGGSFMMGDSGEEFIKSFGDQAFYHYTPYEDNKPAHKVTLDGYYIGKFEITYGDFDVFTNATGREPTNKRDWDRARNMKLSEGRRQISVQRRAPEIPAGASCLGAKAFCEWLSELTGLSFDLPTEAQWEYAARSRGKVVAFATDTGLVERGVNYPRGQKYPHAPGRFPPNPLGLYDMSGNSYEWVKDWYDAEYYSNSPEHNPQGPETGLTKVIRGGGVIESPACSTTVKRAYGACNDEDVLTTGFRIVINTEKPLPKNN